VRPRRTIVPITANPTHAAVNASGEAEENMDIVRNSEERAN
jgi:hypothetical protein